MKKFLSYLTFALSLVIPPLAGETEKLVILGSGPAGLTAAIYAARASLKPLVITGEEPGGQIVLALQVENFPGFPEGISGSDLMDRFIAQAQRFGTRFLPYVVIEADLSERPFTLTLEDGAQIHCETLIIATGTSPQWLGIPSEAPLIGQGVYACAFCDGYLLEGKHAVVIGAGDIALHQVMALSRLAKQVTVVYEQSQPEASKELQSQVFNLPNVNFVPNAAVEEICSVNGNQLTGIKIRNLLNEKEQIIACEGVFVAIGRQPKTELFVNQLELDAEGYIITNSKTTATNIPGVFAAGNAADPLYRQTITASARGCQAALDADKFLNLVVKTIKSPPNLFDY